ALLLLERLAAKKEHLDVISCNELSSTWLVFADLHDDYPSLGNPAIVTPRSYWWPTFLKSDNLLNVAQQIVVIAIVAIGMTMVIIAGGIDLSVGSLIALSAVVATRLIRDVAGAGDTRVVGLMWWFLAGGFRVCAF